MIPEIGQFALIISLCLTLCLGCFGLLGAHKDNSELMSLVSPLTHAQFIFIVLAFVSLAYSFIVDDFSVLYIANNSHSELPNLFKFSAVWGAHEGSLLLWVLILSVRMD